jgi:hypothetical protein
MEIKMIIKYSTFCFIITLLSLVSTAQAAENPVTKELFNNCKVTLDIVDNNFARVQTESNFLQGTKSGKCQGFIDSVNQMNFLNLSRNVSRSLKYCLPASYTSLQGATAVVLYLKKYPQEKSTDAIVVVLRAFNKYFPCG